MESLRLIITANIDSGNTVDEVLASVCNRLEENFATKEETTKLDLELKHSIEVSKMLISSLSSSQQPQAGSNFLHDAHSLGISRARIPALPTFRGTERSNIRDAFKFIDKSKSLIQAYLITEGL